MTAPPDRIEDAWFICKGGYFYRPDCCGYTTDPLAAGLYTEERARAEAAKEPDTMKALPAQRFAMAAYVRPGTLGYMLHTAALAAARAQCCMCGKTGLSIEEDGGPECELHDGRWVCSSDCWERAQPDAIAAAEARGREQGLREAAAVIEERASEILRDPAMEATQTGRGAALYDQAILCAELICDMIAEDAPDDMPPKPRSSVAASQGGDADMKKPRRASGPIDPENGFATTGAEARWIANTEAGVYDVEPTDEELGIAPDEYRIATVDDFRRLTMEQRQRIVPDLLHWAACVNDMERTGIKSSGAFIWVDDDRPGEVREVRFEVEGTASPPADGGEG